MKLNAVLLKIVALLLLSCNSMEEPTTSASTESANQDSSHFRKNENSTTLRDSIIKNLQGKWKETEYPFRLAHFNESTVKFTEEGVIEPPRFKEYSIEMECPFNVNNVKNARETDLFLVMVEDSTCEIVTIAGDTLILSGFNAHTNSDYKIIYRKAD